MVQEILRMHKLMLKTIALPNDKKLKGLEQTGTMGKGEYKEVK